MKRVAGKDFWEDRTSLSALIASAVDHDELVRWAAAVGLGAYSDPASMRALEQLCSDSDPYVKEAAGVSLKHVLEEVTRGTDPRAHGPSRPARWESVARSAGREARLWRLLRLLKDSRPLMRVASARSLGLLEDARALQDLADIAVADPEPHVRQACVLAIGWIADARALEVLEDIVEEDDDPRVRAGAATALGELSDPEAIDTLSAVILGDDEATVRQAACCAIGKCASVTVDSAYRRRPETVLSQQVVDTLREAAEEDLDDDVRDAALETLGSLRRAPDANW